MVRFIPTRIMKYPVDAQSDGFICAFVSALLALPGEADGTVWCGRNRRACFSCGDCGDKTMDKRLHLDRYHHYETITGLGLVWKRGDIGDTLALQRAMDAAGLIYKIADKSFGEKAILTMLADSVDRGIPVLVKLGQGEDWHIVSGIDLETGELYGIDASGHYCMAPSVKADSYDSEGRFILKDWYKQFVCAVITDGRTEPSKTKVLIENMAVSLTGNGGEALEREITAEVEGADSLTHEERQSLAQRLNELAGYTVECRWHAAEAATADIYQSTENAAVRGKLCEITDQYLLFHDLCWKIWGLIGVSPESGFRIADDAGERLTRTEVKNELISLFRKLFEIDLNVLRLLLECTAKLN